MTILQCRKSLKMCTYCWKILAWKFSCEYLTICALKRFIKRFCTRRRYGFV